MSYSQGKSFCARSRGSWRRGYDNSFPDIRPGELKDGNGLYDFVLALSNATHLTVVGKFFINGLYRDENGQTRRKWYILYILSLWNKMDTQCINFNVLSEFETKTNFVIFRNWQIGKKTNSKTKHRTLMSCCFFFLNKYDLGVHKRHESFCLLFIIWIKTTFV